MVVLYYLNIQLETTTIINETNTDLKIVQKKKYQKELLSEVFKLECNNQIINY